MSNSDAAFIGKIIAHPDDDLPRLIYADYLDERGDPRGEFVRVQCELLDRGCEESAKPGGICCDNLSYWTKSVCRACTLRRRERELLASHYPAWVGPLPIRHGLGEFAGVIESTFRFLHRFRRGFVEEIRCTWDDFARHADAIRAATPLRKALLTTRPEVCGYDNRTNETKTLEAGGGLVVVIGPRKSRMIVANADQWRLLLPQMYPGIEFTLPTRVSDFLDIDPTVDSPTEDLIRQQRLMQNALTHPAHAQPR